MARTAIVVKSERRRKAAAKRHKAGKKIQHPTKVYHRCQLCGRIGGYMRRFGICRICFRQLANKGKIMGVRKSSW